MPRLYFSSEFLEAAPPARLCVTLLSSGACSIKVTAGAFYYIVVSGSAPTDAGAFTLTLSNSALAT